VINLHITSTYPRHQLGGRRSPTVFLKGLDNPELGLLNIKFPFEVPGRKFLDVVSAVNNSCRLGNLTELVLAGGGWFPHCRECGHRPHPQIPPADLRTGLNMLLPLPQLKILRLSVAPNFLDILNLKLYRSITAGLSRSREAVARSCRILCK
jgi:hypothetical protein